jgi:hypothetical protein
MLAANAIRLPSWASAATQPSPRITAIISAASLARCVTRLITRSPLPPSRAIMARVESVDHRSTGVGWTGTATRFAASMAGRASESDSGGVSTTTKS